MVKMAFTINLLKGSKYTAERKRIMGHIKDEHLILECYDYDVLVNLREFVLDTIIEEFGEELPLSLPGYIPRAITGLSNSANWLYIPADGSKEGWTNSNVMDTVREKLLNEVIRHNTRNKDRVSILKVTVDEYEPYLTVEYLTKGY